MTEEITVGQNNTSIDNNIGDTNNSKDLQSSEQQGSKIDELFDGGSVPAKETPTWFWGENVPGSGERPDWLLEKYNNATDQAKAYIEAQKKLGAYTGAPEQYALPEGFKAWDEKKFDNFKNDMSDLNINQKTFDKIMEYADDYVKNFSDQLQKTEEDRFAEFTENDIKFIKNDLKHRLNYTDSELNALKLMDVNQIRVLERLLNEKASVDATNIAEAHKGHLKEKVKNKDYFNNVLMMEKDQDGNFRIDTDKEYRNMVEKMRVQSIESGEYYL